MKEQTPLHATSVSSPWQGSLSLVYARRQNRTRPIQQRMQAPLKVQRPFYPEGAEVCHSILLHTAGGMVGGDCLDLDLHLGARSRVLITTAAASKVYGSRGRSQIYPAGRPARQTIQITVGPDACLEWFPQETILFNRAIYHQQLRVELAENATWCSWEIMRLGRSARGEQFVVGELRSRTEIWQHNRPLWIDPQHLPARPATLNSPHALANQPIIGSFLWIGQPIPAPLIQQARSLWHQTEHRGQAGVTQLMSGIICRYRGPSTTHVRHWFAEVWQLLRHSLSNRPACPPRVWQR